jgi:hypothetical protein
MANELRIDLSDPAMQEAFADCQPGEAHTVTMEIYVNENGEELVADVDPEGVEKYSDDDEYEDDSEPDAEPKAVTIVMKKGDAKPT